MATKLPMNVTPVGTAAWPWLNTPDVRYDADGVYQSSDEWRKTQSC